MCLGVTIMTDACCLKYELMHFGVDTVASKQQYCLDKCYLVVVVAS